MAFLQTQTGGSGDGGDRLPILKFHAPGGRLFTLDREQDSGGNWITTETDITMQQPAFAVDFGSLEVGWAFFAKGAAPMWALSPYGKSSPMRPSSPGVDDKGKAQSFKSAFRVKVIGKAIGGVRELGGNAGALIGGMNELHTEYEAAPEAAAGMIPLVKMMNVIPIKSGQATNYQPVFAIQQWVARPEALGPRLVPPPNGGARTAQPEPQPPPQAQQQSNHVPPPPPKAEPVKEREPELAEADMPF